MASSTDPIIVAREGVVSCSLGEEEALLDTRHGIYYSLDRVGAVVWAMIGAPVTLPDIVDALVRRYDVDEAVATRDVADLIAGLHTADLIVHERGEAA